MLSFAGDGRALLALFAIGVTVPEEVQDEMGLSMQATVVRLGCEASIEALLVLGKGQAPDGTPLYVAGLVDAILAAPREELDAQLNFYHQGPGEKAMAEIARRLAHQEWQDADSDWDRSDGLGLFDDSPFFGDDEALADAGGMTALRRQLDVMGLPTSYFPNERPVDRPGRNEPCWCGSGKKYKHCHWREDHLGDTG